MRRMTSLLAASTLAVGGLAFVSQTRAVDPAPPNSAGAAAGGTTVTRTDSTTEVRTNTAANNNNGNNPAAAAPDADDIRKTLAAVTEDAVTKGDFHKLTKNFVDAD